MYVSYYTKYVISVQMYVNYYTNVMWSTMLHLFIVIRECKAPA